MIIKTLLYNTQGNFNDIKLLGDIDDVDLMLLPYCHVGLGMSIRRQRDMHINWKPTTNISKNIGICTMSKEYVKVETRSVDIKIDHENPMVSNKYQLININGIVLCFAIAELPELEQLVYYKDIKLDNPDILITLDSLEIYNKDITMSNHKSVDGIQYIDFEITE